MLAMSPSRLFILRPVATSLLMAAIMLVGMVAYRFLPLSALPEVDYPTIQVVDALSRRQPRRDDLVGHRAARSAARPDAGAQPDVVGRARPASSVITLQFSLDLSLDVAEQEVQAAINAAGNLLPSDLPAPPIYAKVNPADAPILTLALTSKTLPLTQVEDLADTRLAQKISQLTGVGLVSISGGQPAGGAHPGQSAPARRLRPQHRRSAHDDRQRQRQHAQGQFRRAEPRLHDQRQRPDQKAPSDYNDLVVAYRNGAPVHLSDVATAVEGAENTKLAGWMNTTAGGHRQHPAPARRQRHRGRRPASRRCCRSCRRRCPPRSTSTVLTDRTTTIRASVADVEFELGLAVVLVVLVIFLFLRSPSATLIPSLSVPLSLVGTLAVMYLAGFSLNNLSLMALTIATGFVVDDAIVMIENISRYIEAGDSPLQAALKGSEQIGFTIISLTMSLIAVLIPLLFMADVVGRLFREFAITLAVTIIISAIVSLTLVPMMCAKLLRHRPRGGDVAGSRARARNGSTG